MKSASASMGIGQNSIQEWRLTPKYTPHSRCFKAATVSGPKRVTWANYTIAKNKKYERHMSPANFEVHHFFLRFRRTPYARCHTEKNAISTRIAARTSTASHTHNGARPHSPYGLQTMQLNPSTRSGTITTKKKRPEGRSYLGSKMG